MYLFIYPTPVPKNSPREWLQQKSFYFLLSYHSLLACSNPLNFLSPLSSVYSSTLSSHFTRLVLLHLPPLLYVHFLYHSSPGILLWYSVSWSFFPKRPRGKNVSGCLFSAIPLSEEYKFIV